MSARSGPAGRDHAGERGRAQEYVGEVADGDPAQHLVDHVAQLVGPRRVGHARDHVVDGGVTASGVELARDTDRVGVHPGAQQVEPPQAARDRLGGPVRPRPGRSPRCPRCRRGGAPARRPASSPDARAPRTSSSAARSAASASWHRVVPRVEPAEEAVARRERAVVRALGHALHGSRAGIGPEQNPGVLAESAASATTPPSPCGSGARGRSEGPGTAARSPG